MLKMFGESKIDQMAFERFVKNHALPYDYSIAGSVSEANSILDSNSFDLVMLDHNHGDGTAFDIIGNLKGTPSIIVTGKGDEELVVRVMKLGVSDYIIKDTEGKYLTLLPETVQNALNRRNSERELQQYREHLEELVLERTRALESEISERRRAEENYKRLISAVEQAVEVVQILGPDGTIEYINPIAEKILGYSCEEIVGRNPFRNPLEEHVKTERVEQTAGSSSRS